MIKGQRHDDGFFEQQARFDVLRRMRQFAHERDIGFCGQNRLGLAGGGHLPDDQLDIGKALAKPPEGAEQWLVVRDGDSSHREGARNAFGHLASVFNPPFQRLECLIGSLQKDSACGCQFDLSLVAGEQAETQFAFQPINGLAQGRLS